ncbi:helix-turn-helix transcriptional regulator [Bradyrhizobium sp. Arg237L]|uniref:helix-turn-helix domain-containing protein n=1 Tax=Bradyrhizobium sp. Arg237L TaxID=3003352 RepID=UPI00249EA1FE|nr:helix-turn-helix transcriptional regulator [Bradyrhizobium sp. Arg237L]MDI4237771.1 helix-turn-helix transcriptional regulator [Bradyrhizobium sp. Arg237L]
MVNKEPLLSPAQVRAARSWLSWSQDELSTRAAVSQKSIARLELGRSVPHAGTLTKIQHAFENAGIEFLYRGMIATGINTRQQTPSS